MTTNARINQLQLQKTVLEAGAVKERKIVINESFQNKKVNNAYNTVGFLAQTLIPHIDLLIETTKPKRQLKKACNDLLRESELMVKDHYSNFHDFGKVPTEIDEGHEAIDIYNITAKAYDKAVEFFTTRSANEVVSIMALIEKLEKDGVKLADVPIEYEPIG